MKHHWEHFCVLTFINLWSWTLLNEANGIKSNQINPNQTKSNQISPNQTKPIWSAKTIDVDWDLHINIFQFHLKTVFLSPQDTMNSKFDQRLGNPSSYFSVVLVCHSPFCVTSTLEESFVFAYGVEYDASKRIASIVKSHGIFATKFCSIILFLSLS